MLILLPRNSADVVKKKKAFQLICVSKKWLIPDLRLLIYNGKGSIIFLLGFYWLNYTGIPHFTALYIFCKFKVCGNSTSSKSVRTIFPTAFIHFVSHILVILAGFQAFLLLLCLLRWSLISDLWCYYCKKILTCWRLQVISTF